MKTRFGLLAAAFAVAVFGAGAQAPAGTTKCADEGKVCKTAGKWTGKYGGGGKFADMSGDGPFICSMRGWTKFPVDGIPANKDTGVATDPAPGVGKACYIVGSATAAPAPAPAAAPPKAAPTPAPAAPPPAPAKANPTPAPTPAAPASASADGLTKCAEDGKVCNANGAWRGVYGVPGKYVAISGTGPFTCLARGGSHNPPNLSVDDPASGVKKSCLINQTVAAAAPAPVAAAPARSQALPQTCAGGAVGTEKTYTSQSALNSDYMSFSTITSGNAADECKALCARTTGSAPCGWYTVVRWRQDSSATGRSTMASTCLLKNAVSAKDATKPKMAKDQNFGTPSNGLFFVEATTYACTR